MVPTNWNMLQFDRAFEVAASNLQKIARMSGKSIAQI